MGRRRIAVVGAGVAGLTAAHALRTDHEVVVFEADDRPGGHAHTIEVPTPDGPIGVDTGFVVLNDRNYPSFERLLADLDVATQPSDMSMSVSTEDGSFEFSSTSLSGLFAQPRNALSPAFLGMLRDVKRFQRASVELLADDADPSISLGHYLEAGGYGRLFIDRLLVPQASAVWSADPRQMWEFPARFLVRFFHNHGMLGLRDRPKWRTVRGGSVTYVRALCARLGDAVRLDAPVTRVTRDDDGVEVTARGAAPERFDEVVLAVHGDQALALLGDASDDERRLLGAFRFGANETVLHTDVALLPRRRRAWASWNYHELAEQPGRTTITYHMNRLQDLPGDTEFCVTLNRTAAIDPAKIIATMQYAHPIVTPESAAAQDEHATISGVRHTHYCGAYWRWGFHEDGVVTALRAVDAIRDRRRAEVAA